VRSFTTRIEQDRLAVGPARIGGCRSTDGRHLHRARAICVRDPDLLHTRTRGPERQPLAVGRVIRVFLVEWRREERHCNRPIGETRKGQFPDRAIPERRGVHDAARCGNTHLVRPLSKSQGLWFTARLVGPSSHRNPLENWTTVRAGHGGEHQPAAVWCPGQSGTIPLFKCDSGRRTCRHEIWFERKDLHRGTRDRTSHCPEEGQPSSVPRKCRPVVMTVTRRS